MSDTTPRGIANLATRRVDPKRMISRNRQPAEAPVIDSADSDSSPAVEAVTAPAPVLEQPKSTPGRSTQVVVDGSGYQQFERKDTRLREGQIADLTTHARQLNKAKVAPAPRITENTLIRVAVDLLLSRAAEMQGDTEADIRHSLGL